MLENTIVEAQEAAQVKPEGETTESQVEAKPPSKRSRRNANRQAQEAAQVEAKPEATQVASIVESAQERETRLLRLADGFLSACIGAAKAGALAARAGNIQSGYNACEYIKALRLLGHSRDGKIKVLEGDLNKVSAIEVNASDLMKTYQVFTILGEGKTEMPWGAMRSFRKLIAWEDCPIEGERWYIPTIALPDGKGFADLAKEKFSEASAAGWDAPTCLKVATDLELIYNRAMAAERERKVEAAEAAREAADKEAKLAQDVKALAKAQEARMEAEAKAAQEAAQEAARQSKLAVSPEAKAEAEAAQVKAEADAKIAKEAAEAAEAKRKEADKAAKDNAKRAADAKAAQETAERQAKIAEAKAQSTEQKKASAEAGKKPENLVKKIGQSASPKDLGGMMVDFVLECENPSEALREFFRLAQVKEGKPNDKGIVKGGFDAHAIHAIKCAIVGWAKHLEAQASKEAEAEHKAA